MARRVAGEMHTKALSRRDNDGEGASLVYGPTSPPLWKKTLADLIKEQATRYGEREAVLVPWQSARHSYARLGERSALLAKALLEIGVKHGECVGIMAGNCYEYIEIFLGAGRIGCPSAVFNNTFSPEERVKMSSLTGTTGLPKAAALSHNNIINNGRYVGLAMRLTEDDVVCCPPPLFHCFGLVIGFLASFCSGSKIVFPSPTFDATSTLDTIAEEKATALLGVPAMLFSMLEVQKKSPRHIETLRTGVAAASPVPSSLMSRLESEMHIPGMLIAYCMTKTSPVTLITTLEDPHDKRVSTVGHVLPHTVAKVVDSDGKTLRQGARGEICTTGFALQKGYWNDPAQTQHVMRPDREGTVWMHTGDEGFLDDAGYGHVTGRIKDIIIRGGENISPAEVEDCLLRHPAVKECCVVGLDDDRYGEVVSCFLSGTEASQPGKQELRDWVTTSMDRTKAPQHIFWLGDEGVGQELPKTASGKYMKHLIRIHGNSLLRNHKSRAKI